ncbi:sulfotransferase [Xanthomonas hyacinthi]|uniref:Sulfotransferase family protein n=1 Tax=Xanthomonas hyacinthi TaxID=56455 RepID=A0A2S7EXC5_9XANT|nr:Stf0 family sulfotransferase [Xanthomonas hyacinthi]KLD76117.1 sulfotransferase [Xanthomonas hyacinthi DSM 19077]PPU97761.1 sulfotransferase family protein [Xanthomonas hyacinthi]QGY77149.1 sulfotransferase [Xanthomonas hyacinthi]
MAEASLPLLASRWSLWMSHPASGLATRIRSDLAPYAIGDDMASSIVEFVREYRNAGRRWSSRGLRGDEVMAPLLGLADSSAEMFEFIRAQIAQAEHNKWVGGSLHDEVASAQMQYKRFVIVSTPRSGTHLLRTLLGSHPCIEMHGEAFNRFGQHLLPYSVQNSTAQQILERHLFRPYFEYVEAVGFVLFRDLDTEWAGVNVWETLADLGDLKIVLLDRRNRLAQLVSLKKSLLDHVWYVGRDDKRWREQISLSISRDELVDFIDRDLANRAEFLERFDRHEIFPIEYEDLLTKPASVHAKLLAFLGVSSARLQPGTGKKETSSVSSTVDNNDQLRSELKGTRYECYI